MQRDNSDLVTAPGARTHRVINDGGMLWIAPIPKPSPVIDKISGPKGAAAADLAGPTAAAADAAGPPPPPLVPFAGCDRKALPPSPAKPFAMQASPIKPSPIHDRVEHATAAVASKAWGARQAKMSEFFGGGGGAAGARPPAAAGAAPAAKVAAAVAPAAPAAAAAAAPAPAPQPTTVLGAVQDMDF